MTTSTYQTSKKQTQECTSYAAEPVSQRREVMGLHISCQSYDTFLTDIIQIAQQRKSAYVCFANVHMLVEAAKDSSFAQAVNNASRVVTDGVPLLWVLRAFYKIRQERITGLDVLPDLLRKAESARLPVYIYGSTPAVLAKCKAYFAAELPKLLLAGLYSPPFRSLNADEEQQVIDDIIASGAALVFVALGCPKQEKWMASLSNRIPAVLLGIGGALPVLAGEHKRSPNWMQQWGLEWFYRLVQEPRRLAYRYMYTNFWFTYYFLKQLIKRRAQI